MTQLLLFADVEVHAGALCDEEGSCINHQSKNYKITNGKNSSSVSVTSFFIVIFRLCAVLVVMETQLITQL